MNTQIIEYTSDCQIENLNNIIAQKQNIIINLMQCKNIDKETIQQFIPISIQQYSNNKSLVIVSPILFDDIEQIIIVPTLQEAKDIIEMEEIERDLGL